MKKLLLTLMLAVVSSSAMAEWVELTKDLEKTFTIYVDPTTVRKSGNKVKMWHLTDLKMAEEFNGRQYMSKKVQAEYDCKEDQSHILFISAHSENMGIGNTVSWGNNPNKNIWTPIPPNSVEKIKWEYACGK